MNDEIHDLIQRFEVSGSKGDIYDILEILQKINDKLNELEYKIFRVESKDKKLIKK